MRNLVFKIIFFQQLLFLPFFLNTSLANPLIINPYKIEVSGHFLDSNLKEASGLATSFFEPDRLFHVNDSGDSSRLLVTNFKGDYIQSITIKNHESTDIEDLSSGRCFEHKNCLFIADIGDNRRQRQNIQIIIVEEKPLLTTEVDSLKLLEPKYEDGPRDAESLALGPNQHLYILTKEHNFAERKAFASRLYILHREKWHNLTTKNDDKEALTLEYRGEIDLKKFSQESSMFANVPTSMDIDLELNKMLILTYSSAYIVDLKLNPQGEIDWRNNLNPNSKNIKKIPLKRLFQQEAVSFLPNKNKGSNQRRLQFMYTTEAPLPPLPAEMISVEFKLK